MALVPVGGGGALTTTTDVGIRMHVTGRDVVDAEFRRVEDAIERTRRRVQGLDLQLRHFDRFLVYLGAGSLLFAAQGFFKMATEMQNATVRLSAFTRDFGEAERQLNSVVNLAQKSPFTLNTLTEAFVKLKAAGLEPISDAQGNGLLKNILDGLAAFGASDDQVRRAFIAIQQMAGKGVISMEELRQQLGESFPAAMRLMAEGMGLSVSRMVAMVSRGQVDVETGLEALSRKTAEKFGGAAELMTYTFDGALNQLRTSIQKFAKTTLVDSGVMDGIVVMIKKATAALTDFDAKLSQRRRVGPMGSGQQEGAEDFMTRMGQKLEEWAILAARAVEPLLSLVSIIGTLAGAIGNLTNGVPAEIVGGGILGFILFGASGVLPGAIFGAFHDTLAQVAIGIAGIIDKVDGFLRPLGFDLGKAGFTGLIGWFIGGVPGALAGFLLGLMDDALQVLWIGLAKMDTAVAGWWAGVKYRFNPKNWMDVFNDWEGSKAASKKASEDFWNNNVGPGKMYGDLNDTMLENFGKGLSGLGKSGEESAKGMGKAESAVRGMIDAIKSGIPEVAKARETIVAKFKGFNDIGAMSEQDFDKYEHMLNTMNTLSDKIEGGSIVSGQEVAKWRRELEGIDGLILKYQEIVNGMDDKDSRLPGLVQEIADMTQERDKFKGMIDLLEGVAGSKRWKEAQEQFESFRNQIERFSGLAMPGMTAFDQKNKQILDTYNSQQQSLDQIRTRIEGSNLALADQGALLAMVDEAEAHILRIKEKSLEVAIRENEFRKVQQQRTIDDQLDSYQDMLAGLRFDNTGDERGRALYEAQSKIDDNLKALERDMENIMLNWENMGYESEEAAAAQVEQLKIIYEQMRTESDIWLEHFKLVNSEAFKVVEELGHAFTDSLGGAIGDLATRSGDLQTTLNNLWESAVRAIAQYIAKLLIAKAIEATMGAGSSGAGILGQIFGVTAFMGGAANGGIFPGGVKMFAKGGIINGPTLFGMAGEAGTEAIMPLGKMSDGSLGVRSAGGGGDRYSIFIRALDSRSVAQLFHENGHSLVQAMRSRASLNRGMNW